MTGDRAVSRPTAAGVVGADKEITVDEVLDALANGRRRLVLEVLRDGVHETPVQVSALARSVQRREDDLDKPSHTVSWSEMKSAYISLRQGHLRILDDVGAVTWDDRAQEVAPGDQFEVFVDVLDATRDQLGDVDVALMSDNCSRGGR